MKLRRLGDSFYAHPLLTSVTNDGDREVIRNVDISFITDRNGCKGNFIFRTEILHGPLSNLGYEISI
jgi:hypothetical protein